MGIDFDMEAVTVDENNKIKKIDGQDNFFEWSEFTLWELFKFSKGENKTIVELLTKEVSFNWFDNLHQGWYKGEEPTVDDLWDPRIVLECIEEVYNAIKKHNKRFPNFYYWLYNNDKNLRSSNSDVFIGNTHYQISGDWDKCIATEYIDPKERQHINPKKIDLRTKTKIDCYRAIYKEETRGKGKLIKAEKVILYFHKKNYFEYYQKILEEMMKLCHNAIEQKGLIYTYSSD